MGRRSKDIAATTAALALLAGVLFLVFVWLEEWAFGAFARPLMGAALVAVIELGLLVLALCLAPALSRLLRRLLGRPIGAGAEAAPDAPTQE